MQRPRPVLMKAPVIAVAFLCTVGALPGCSAAPPATGSPPATRPAQTAGSPSAAAVPSAAAAVAFTVVGVHPVRRNGSQDTHAQTPKAGCDSVLFAADLALGIKVTGGFTLAGFRTSAYLLRHFLQGQGTEVDYHSGSAISEQALASSAFKAVNKKVQRSILRQLKAGKTRVRLSAAQLPKVAFDSANSDLYWGFRGTQGLTVTGSGSQENGRYAGTLSYVIRDSYGFPASDALGGFGAPMRYLQTACGAPEHSGGAHWFPDTIAVTVPFSHPARKK